MNVYIYDGEFNAPMNGYVVDSHDPEITDGKMMVMDYVEDTDPFTGPHNPTVYSSRSEMKAIEEGLPFTDPPEPWEFEADEGEY